MKRLLILLTACASTPPPAAPAPHADPHAHHAMHHRFENADQWTRVFDDPARDAWQMPDKVVATLALAPGMVVADVGAGTGYFEKRLSAAVGDSGAVIAVDIEPDMVRYLRDRAQREGTPNVEARLGAPDDPKLTAASVDRVLIVDTWHHIDDRVAYSKKLATALKPGGAVFVVDFTLETEKGPPKQHRLAPAQVIEELTQAGLKAAVADAGLPDQYIVKASL
ncbi:MAG TPA: class I SAM-dependent methyltransferase [Kofleriaceae bacterium]|nr:class I SAM-dependent methyltransferase [Kofleriaceae bacterium]